MGNILYNFLGIVWLDFRVALFEPNWIQEHRKTSAVNKYRKSNHSVSIDLKGFVGSIVI